MATSNNNLSKEAARWVSRKSNQKLLFKKFVDPFKFPASQYPLVIFMAGSPGAGKTEFVRELKELEKKGQLAASEPFAVIDPDAIRDFLPGYTGSNSHLFQNAISIGVTTLFNQVIKNKQNAIIDGTFSNYKHARQNVEKAIESNSGVMVFYIFQHPTVAWDFTQKREVVEGRRITQKDFIDKFIAAKDTVNKIKQEFGDKVFLNVVIKDYKDSVYNKRIERVFTNIEEVEKFTKFRYNKSEIERLL